MKIECTKTRFATEKDALFYIQKIKNKSDRQVIPTRAYLCRCGAWHLTSKRDFVEENRLLGIRVSALEKEIDKLRAENAQLKGNNPKNSVIDEEVMRLKAEIILLKNQDNKEREKSINADERVRKLNETINDKNRVISNLRKDSERLIMKLVQLEKQVQKTP